MPEDFSDFSLAKTISNLESKVNDDVTDEQPEDDVMPSAGDEMGAGDSENHLIMNYNINLITALMNPGF